MTFTDTLIASGYEKGVDDLTNKELIELLKERSDTDVLAGTIIALESLEESIKDWRFNLRLRLFPGFVLRRIKKALKEAS